MLDLGDSCQLAVTDGMCSYLQSGLWYSILHITLICSDAMFSLAMCMTQYLGKKGATVTYLLILICVLHFDSYSSDATISAPQKQTSLLILICVLDFDTILLLV